MSSIALVDCNNFFVSCERVFNPELIRRPVVVLSSNDGCIIARSAEAKRLGIPMGAPLFQWKHFLQNHDVAIFSSNFPLYRDMSHRVMATVGHFCSEIDIYSVDEAFCHLGNEEEAKHLRRKVGQWTGIPVSIGVAPTKTLAKVAAAHAKKGGGVSTSCSLKGFPIENVWGIGRRLSAILKKRGVHTADQLISKDEGWLKKVLGTMGMRTALELKGISCYSFDQEVPSKQSITTSRSFGTVMTSWEELKGAVGALMARGGEKLREEGSLASWMEVMSSEGFGRPVQQAFTTFDEPTSITPFLLNKLEGMRSMLFHEKKRYKKAGVLLGGLVSKREVQQDLFAQKRSPKWDRAMEVVDQVNRRFDLHFGIEKKRESCQKRCSNPYTTSWDHLLTIEI